MSYLYSWCDYTKKCSNGTKVLWYHYSDGSDVYAGCCSS